MNEKLNADLRRWRDADASGRDDEADAALRAVFDGMEPVRPNPSVRFTADVMAAVAAAAVEDARVARRTRRALVVGGTGLGLALAYFAGGWVLSQVSSAMVWLLDGLVGAVVRTAMAMHGGGNIWGVMTTLGRATAALASDPTVTVLMLMIQGIAFGALAALHRLLGNDREWLK